MEIRGGVEQSVRLELTTAANTSPLALDVAEPTDVRLRRLISENPVIIFSRPSCCMCHAMKNLLHTLGVHPTIIALDDYEISSIPSHNAAVPALFIAGDCVGSFERLVGIHLSGELLPKLAAAGALPQPLMGPGSFI